MPIKEWPCQSVRPSVRHCNKAVTDFCIIVGRIYFWWIHPQHNAFWWIHSQHNTFPNTKPLQCLLYVKVILVHIKRYFLKQKWLPNKIMILFKIHASDLTCTVNRDSTVCICARACVRACVCVSKICIREAKMPSARSPWRL